MRQLYSCCTALVGFHFQCTCAVARPVYWACLQGSPLGFSQVQHRIWHESLHTPWRGFGRWHINLKCFPGGQNLKWVQVVEYLNLRSIFIVIYKDKRYCPVGGRKMEHIIVTSIHHNCNQICKCDQNSRLHILTNCHSFNYCMLTLLVVAGLHKFFSSQDRSCSSVAGVL